MTKKTDFGPKFGPFGSNLGPFFIYFFCLRFYLCQQLYIVASYHCMQFLKKLMNQTQDNGKKLALGLISAYLPKFAPQSFCLWILPLLDVTHCCKLSLYAISKKINEPNLRKWQKTQFWAHQAQSQAAKFCFSKIWLYQSLDIMVSYYHSHYQKKLMIQF